MEIIHQYDYRSLVLNILAHYIYQELLEEFESLNQIQYNSLKDLMKIIKLLKSKYSYSYIPFGFLIKIFGWNMSSIESSKSLKAPEIIIQTANVDSYTDIAKNPELIVHDEVIPAEASLAKKLLSDSNYEGKNKYFMGVREGHNTELNNPLPLVEKINEMMKAI